jgi:hypothetical protein
VLGSFNGIERMGNGSYAKVFREAVNFCFAKGNGSKKLSINYTNYQLPITNYQYSYLIVPFNDPSAFYNFQYNIGHRYIFVNKCYHLLTKHTGLSSWRGYLPKLENLSSALLLIKISPWFSDY